MRTTRPGCRSVWTAAGTAGAGGDPGTRPPGRGPRLAHHAAGLSIGHGHGDTFTTRPGCRSVWTAAGTAGAGGDPGTRPPGRGPRFAHHAAGLSIGPDGRGHGRCWRRSWNTSTRLRPSLCSPACRRRSATRSPRGRAVDRCGRSRARPALVEILEHVHQVEALALRTTRPGCRSVWTAAGTAGAGGDPGTRPPGRGPRFAGQHAGDDRPRARRHVHHAAGLSIGVDGRGHGRCWRRSWTTSTRSRPSLCAPRGRAVDRPRARRHVHHRPGCRSVWTRPYFSRNDPLLPLTTWPATIGRSWRRSWNTSTCSLRRRCSPRGRLSIGVDQGRAVDRPRARSALAEILEHVHRVEALALLASMPATAAGTAGAGGDPGTRPPGRGPRFAHHAAGLSIGRGHGDTFTTGRAVDRCGRPRARPEILEHVHPVEALALLP